MPPPPWPSTPTTCRLSARERSTFWPCRVRASDPMSSTRRLPPSCGPVTPRDGHQPPTTRQVGVLTASVTSFPAVTTAIGVPFHVPVVPVSATAVFGVRREASAAATAAGAATRPPAYSGRTAAVRSTGRPRPLTPLGAGLGVVALG